MKKYLRKTIIILLIILLTIISLAFCKYSLAQYRMRINVKTLDLSIIEFQDNTETVSEDVNLYGTSEIYNYFYDENGEWKQSGDSSVVSILVDVEPGDMIVANSFQATPDNKGTVNGARITYLYDETIVYTLTPTDVYNEYTALGYILVPAEVNKVNVTWWNDNEENYLHITKKSEDEVTSENNLYGTSEIFDYFYNEDGEWTQSVVENSEETESGDTNLQSTKIVSMLVNVEPEDMIVANSFMATPANGGDENGIRVTYLLDDTIFESLSPSEVYTEYSTNGYLTVPEGVNKINVAWWSEYVGNYLSIIKPEIEIEVETATETNTDTESDANKNNLYDPLSITDYYYDASGIWVQDEQIVSMIVDVSTGDKIEANSFKAKGENGNTDTDGIIITYLLDEAVVKSLTAEEVYTAYSTTGYLTVPDGVNKVNVVWWNDSSDNYLYITN